jgi:hypothetical protein
LVDILKVPGFYREPNINILKMSRMKCKALVMGRYGMLDCGKNYEKRYKRKNCTACDVLDDESHRINECQQ